MEINDILLDAFGGLFGAPVHKKNRVFNGTFF